MANISGILRRHRKVWLGAGAICVVGLLLLAFTRAGKAPSEEAWASAVVTQGPFSIEQSFSGRIVPGDQVEVLSPADATVEAMTFSFGERVEAGQVLYHLSEKDIWRKETEAQIGLYQAEYSARKMQNWMTGPEVRSAERSLENARAQLQDVQRRHDEGQRLYDRGLISRTEMEGLGINLRQATQGALASEDALSETIARGTGSERQISLLQRDLAGARYADVQDSEGAVVRAARSGVIVRPLSASMGEMSTIKSGSKITQGQSLGVIAALDGLDVLFKVDEADLALLQDGMLARITGPGFSGQALEGYLIGVAGEAEAGSSADKTLFAARIRLKNLSEEAAAILRIGMTAHLSLRLYENPRALTIPIASLGRRSGQIKVRNNNGLIETRQITLGRIGPDQAEVLSGLKAGETVVWSPSA